MHLEKDVPTGIWNALGRNENAMKCFSGNDRTRRKKM